MKKLMYFIAALALSVGLLPTAALAAEGGDTSGSFTALNVLPTITSVEVIPTGGGGAVTTMTPGTAYKAKIVAGDANTVEDIDNIRVALVLDLADADPTDYFTVTAATAAAGDTYTNNGKTFTVLSTIAGGTTLKCYGTGAPSASGNLVRTSGEGTDPIVFSSFTSATPSPTGNNQALAWLMWDKDGGGSEWTISSPAGVTNYSFTVTAANAAAGDTYTNNGKTFTVLSTIAGGTTLTCSGTGAPSASGNLVRTSGEGTDPIVFASFTSADATTWSLTSGSCTKADPMTLTMGTWEFYFTVGKVATEAPGGSSVDGWDLFGEVKDQDTAQGMWDDRDLAMQWYGAVTINSGTAAFGDVALGVVDDPSSAISTTYISNGDYKEQVKTDDGTAGAQWKSGSNVVALKITEGTPSVGQFKLMADDDTSTTDYVQVLSATYADIATDEGLTLEAGDLTTDNTLWLSLGSSGILVGTYTGTVYFQIANR